MHVDVPVIFGELSGLYCVALGGVLFWTFFSMLLGFSLEAGCRWFWCCVGFCGGSLLGV